MKKKSSQRQNLLGRCEQDHQRLATELSNSGFLLQGTITQRWMRCGKPSCSCQRNPEARHGPYHQWTVKRRGKTVSVYLDEDQAIRLRSSIAPSCFTRAAYASSWL